jgi:hypothetical protein
MKGNEMKLGLVLSATDKMSRVVEQATQKSNKSLQKLKRETGEFSKKMAEIGTGIMAVGASLGVAAFKGIENVSSKAQNINNLTKELGNISSDSVQVYANMLHKVGIDQDVFQKGVARLAKNMTEVKLGGSAEMQRAFKALGLSVTNMHGSLRSTDEMMLQITDRLSKMKDSTAKTGLIMSLFGRSGKELIPILNQGAAGFEEERKAMQENGELMSSSEISNLVKTKQKLVEIQEKLEGMVVRVVASHINQINSLIDKVSQIADGISKWVKNNKGLVDGLAKALPYIAGVDASIVMISGIIKATMAIQTVWAVVSKISSLSLIDLRLRAIYAMDSIKAFGIAERLVSVWTKVAAGAQWLLNAAFVASPIGGIVVAVGALTVGIVLLWKKFAGFRAFLKTTWDVIKGFGNILKEYVIDRVKDLLSGIGNIGKAIGLLFTGHFKTAGLTALEGIRQINGYNSGKKVFSNSTSLIRSVSNTYNRHSVIEKAAQHSTAKSSTIYSPASASYASASAVPGSNPVIQYHQIINVAPGSNQDDFVKALNAHKRDVIAVLNDYFKNQARISYR